ncbi:ATP-dependent DNA helicase [Trichonephila clavata]|uniref:ATP-dependent DNA helicase n=1 Tax=Trichonephila clavata TaxID=2740835 RepID=A0A8X6LZC7_TRICU|nr:ATP-dependent DNA helicase [Trichonephila clavata]
MYSLLDSKQDGFALDSHRANEKSGVPLQQRRHFSDKKPISNHSSGSDDNPQITRATFQEAAVGFKRNLTRSLQYVALSRVTSIQGLYILGEYKAPPPPREDDLILQEMKRLKAHSILPKYAFLHQHNDPNTLQIMYHNVQSLNAHHEDIAADPCMMNCNILLFAETWTVVGDKFALDHFDHYHLLIIIRVESLVCISTHLPLYVQMPWEKKKVRTSYPQEEDDPSLECGPDLLDRNGDIDWAEDDKFPY